MNDNLSVIGIGGRQRSEIERTLTQDMTDTLDYATPETPLIGFVLLGFYQDGSTTQSTYRPNPDEHKIGYSMWDAWARETLNNQLGYANAQKAARDLEAGS